MITTQQYSDLGLLFLRIVVASVFISHAFPKFMHPKATAESSGIPKMALPLVILGIVEVVASLYLIFGFYLQLGALILAGILVGAITMKIAKWQTPFVSQERTGWELDLVLLAACLAILAVGGGSYTLQ